MGMREDMINREGRKRILIYLFASAAEEWIRRGSFRNSEPNQAKGFIKLIKERNKKLEDFDNDNLNSDFDEEREEMELKLAFNESIRLLYKYSDLLDKLAERMETGLTSVGDCVTFIEKMLLKDYNR